jgi:hypothetical protein
MDYNPNAARLGFAPVLGPFLARTHINDKDLRDGYDVGLNVDGAIQILAFSVLVAGVLYAAIGIPEKPKKTQASFTPRIGVGLHNASVGAAVNW